jgi:hypothetical protein
MVFPRKVLMRGELLMRTRQSLNGGTWMNRVRLPTHKMKDFQGVVHGHHQDHPIHLYHPVHHMILLVYARHHLYASRRQHKATRLGQAHAQRLWTSLCLDMWDQRTQSLSAQQVSAAMREVTVLVAKERGHKLPCLTLMMAALLQALRRLRSVKQLEHYPVAFCDRNGIYRSMSRRKMSENTWKMIFQKYPLPRKKWKSFPNHHRNLSMVSWSR